VDHRIRKPRAFRPQLNREALGRSPTESQHAMPAERRSPCVLPSLVLAVLEAPVSVSGPAPRVTRAFRRRSA
jgi:hypothetical protein